MTRLGWGGCESKQQPPCYVLLLLFFLATQCMLLQVSQTLQHVANVGLGNARFRLVKRGQHLETTIVFAPPFLVYLHHPHACSIIPRIGLFSPHTPKQRRVCKFECRRRRVRMCAYLSPWPPWIATTSLICTLALRAWGLHLGLTWSLLSPCALTMRPGGLHLSWTWATLRWGGGLHSNRSLLHGDDDLGAQLHLAL